jgi:CRP-like cAMP-binding protein
MMNKLLRTLETMKYGNKEIVQVLSKLFLEVSFRKGTIISSPIHSFPVLYFIESGLIKVYYEKDQKEYILNIIEHGFLLPSKGIFRQNETYEYFQTLLDTKGWALNLRDAETLCLKYPVIFKMLLELYEETIREGLEREMLLRIQDAETRFNLYKSKNRTLLFTVNNEVMSSYLRMSPKHLSRMKAADGKKKSSSAI